MLKNLHIENIAVVKNADIVFYDGFNILTGETGVGKSVIVDCLKLLGGSRASRDLLRYGEESACIEAIFTDVGRQVLNGLDSLGIPIDDREVIIRYNIYSDGKSVIRINGKTVNKSFIKQIGKGLISVCAQDDARISYNTEVCTSMLDSFSGNETLLEDYREIYKELEICRENIALLASDEASLRRERDMLEYQIKDIESKKLKSGEEEALEDEKKRLGSIEKINKQIKFSYKILHGASNGGAVSYLLNRASNSLSQIADVLPQLAEISEKLSDMSYDIIDIAERIREYEDDSGEDPTVRIDKIESRLECISSLKRRYGNNIAEILEFCRNAKRRLDEIENSDELIEEYSKKADMLTHKASEIADKLTERRIEAAELASKKVLEVLEYLDMPGVQFKISVDKDDKLNSLGHDRVEFLIATNPGEELKNMDSVVSGGEMSRITLALQNVMNEKDGVGCAVYDEIDTGISGKTSRKIGYKLKDISKNVQIICVTHSAQIAALADNHYKIEKHEENGRAHTTVNLLSDEIRVEEVARILGGINVTQTQREAARQLIDDTKY